MNKQVSVVGQIEHDASGLGVDVVLHETKRPFFTAEWFGIAFRNSSRELLEKQVIAAIDQALEAFWTPTLETCIRLPETETPYLSLDRYWTLHIPGGDLLRANWRTDGDDNRQRLQRAYIANLPEHYGVLPLVYKSDNRQHVYMPYSDAAWNGFQQTVQKLRQQAIARQEPPVTPTRMTVFVPPRVSRYEVHYSLIESLISDHLEIDYSIIAGEHWLPDSNNILMVNSDGYDDSDRAVVEQIRSGERCYFALEMLMRVLSEKHVIPEGDYLITAR